MHQQFVQFNKIRLANTKVVDFMHFCPTWYTIRSSEPCKITFAVIDFSNKKVLDYSDSSSMEGLRNTAYSDIEITDSIMCQFNSE